MPGGVPDADLERLVIDFEEPDGDVDSEGDLMLLPELVGADTAEDAGFADALGRVVWGYMNRR